MAETTNETPSETNVPTDESSEVQPSRLQNFVNKHPRAAKVAAITGAVGTAIGVVCMTKTLQANKEHLDAAGDHAKEALHELSTSVSPQDPEA